jgi:hypothetical protein
MLRLRVGFFAVLVGATLAACSRTPKTNEAIRQAVVEHLQKNSGLDVSAMNIDVKNVEYRGDEADATVAFTPKSTPDGGMAMRYTLESRGGKWVVKGKAGGGQAAEQMPGGHPQAGGAASGAGQQADLPPGHPPVGGVKPAQGEQPKSDLPPGHPPTSGAKQGQSSRQQPQSDLPPGHPPVGGAAKK